MYEREWYLYRPYENKIDPIIGDVENVRKLLIFCVYLKGIADRLENRLGQRINVRLYRIQKLLAPYRQGQLDFTPDSLDETFRNNEHISLNMTASDLNRVSVLLFIDLDKAYNTEDYMESYSISEKDVNNMTLAVRSLHKSIKGNNFELSMTYVLLGKHLFEELLSYKIVMPTIDTNDIRGLDYYLENIVYPIEVKDDLKPFVKMIQVTVVNKLIDKEKDKFRDLYGHKGYEELFKAREKLYGNLLTGKMMILNTHNETITSFIYDGESYYKNFENLLDEYIELNKAKGISLARFLESKNIENNHFKNSRKLLENRGILLDKFKKLEEIFENNSLRSYHSLVNVIERTIQDINNGMIYLDYIRRGYRLSKLEELIKNTSIKSKFNEKDLLVIKKFISSNRGKDKDVKYKEQMDIVYKDINGNILYTKEMKQQVFDYMDKNKIPYTIGAFKGLLKKLKDTGSMEA